MPGGMGMASSSSILTVHSQSAIAPNCPPNTAKLWSGYSFGWIANGDHGWQGQDFGRSGSCLKTFAPLPLIQCQGRQVNGTRCRSASQNARSYWLASKQSAIPEKDTVSHAHISRCSVCQVSGAVVTLHSQSTAIPDCPHQWMSLWTGYSHLSVSQNMCRHRRIS